MHTLDILVPAPQRCCKSSGKFALSALKKFWVDPAWNDDAFAGKIRALFSFFGLTAEPVSDPAEAQFCLFESKAVGRAGAFTLEITPEGFQLSAGERSGADYALAACRQIFFGALRCGTFNAAFDCGRVEDQPRFEFRSLHLDSARQFQSVSVICQVLKLMAELRLNVFHWHLVDNEGWRLKLESAPGLENHFLKTPGYYTAGDIAEIRALAQSLNIEIIPEIDIPGHSIGTLEYFPQYACENADGVVGEFCLGNEEGKTFIKSVLDEVMELFPDSRYIHIGGDEAETRSWDKCPRCRRAMQEANCSTMRQLENKFMIEMSRHVVAAGRIPVQWGTCSDQRYPVDTVIQTWLDIREPLRVAANGNKVIYSVHTSLYFDYPANLSEPFETWMFELSERGVYMTDPYIIWPDAVKDAILGTEACLWTEQVPQWRVIRKILPRLAAYSECAWSLPENKDYHNFAQRREYLESAGWVDYLYRS